LRAAAKNGFVFPQFYGDYYVACAENLACKWGNLPDLRWKNGMGLEITNKTYLADHLISQGIHSLDEFTDHLREIEYDFWNNRFPVYNRWKERWWRSYQKRGYITMLTGFVCSGEMRKNNVINYPVQGAAFHCLLWSLIRLDEYILKNNLQSRIIGQIHDAIVLDVYPPEREMFMKEIKDITTRQLLDAWKWIIVPLDIDFELAGVDESWADMRSVEYN